MSEIGAGMVGVGNIGAAMAQRLVDWPGGFTVYDVRAEAIEPLVAAGARGVGSLAELGEHAAVISIVVRDDAQVREVVDGLLPVVAPDSVLAIHSTIQVETAMELAEVAAKRDVHVIDAPVSGGAMGAADGRLAVMVGGDREAYERAKPVFSRWAALSVHLGPAGAGTRTKLARNLLTFVGYTAAAEAQRLAEAAGVDLSKLAAVVRHSDGITGGPSAVMIRPTTAPMAGDDPLRPIFEHTAELGEKDLSLALALGDALGVDLPFTSLALSGLAEGLGVPHQEKP